MRFLYVADVPWWATARHGSGIVKYHGTSHHWDLCAIADDAGQMHISNFDQDSYDLVVYGCLPIWWMATERLIPSKHTPVLVTFASFRDARGMTCAEAKTGKEMDISRTLRDSRVAGIVINDSRMQRWAIRYDLPLIFHPDKVDPEVFYPMARVDDRQKLRIGWAGSTHHWQNQKHLDEIIEAASQVDGIELVLQRREVEGLKSASEMNEWYAMLDAYICANDALTPDPVPVIEAWCCGLQVITTRCGQSWPIYQATRSASILEDSSVGTIRGALKSMESGVLHGITRNKYSPLLWPDSGEATHFTETCAELLRWRS